MSLVYDQPPDRRPSLLDEMSEVDLWAAVCQHAAREMRKGDASAAVWFKSDQFRYLCDQHGLDFDYVQRKLKEENRMEMEATNAPICESCGAECPPPKKAWMPPRRYCSKRCAQREWSKTHAKPIAVRVAEAAQKHFEEQEKNRPAQAIGTTIEDSTPIVIGAPAPDGDRLSLLVQHVGRVAASAGHVDTLRVELVRIVSCSAAWLEALTP